MKRPSFQFYPGDWVSNKNLRRCTREERGAWIDVMCLLHDSDEYGILRWDLSDIAQAINAPTPLVASLVKKGVLKGIPSNADISMLSPIPQPNTKPMGGIGDGIGECLGIPLVYTPVHGGKKGDSVILIDNQEGPLWYSSRMVTDEYLRQKRGAFGNQSINNPNASRKIDAKEKKTTADDGCMGVPNHPPMGGIGEGFGIPFGTPPSSSSSSSSSSSFKPLYADSDESDIPAKTSAGIPDLTPPASQEKSAQQEKVQGESAELKEIIHFVAEHKTEEIIQTDLFSSVSEINMLSTDRGLNVFPPCSDTPPAAKKAAKKKGVDPDTEEGRSLLAFRATWSAYHDAMMNRYQEKPLHSRAVNAMLKQFINSVGMDDAPSIIRFYVEMNDPFYAGACHPVNLLVRDQQKIRILWSQKERGIDLARHMPITRKAVQDTLASLHGNFHLKDYRSGVDEDGRLIDL